MLRNQMEAGPALRLDFLSSQDTGFLIKVFHLERKISVVSWRKVEVVKGSVLSALPRNFCLHLKAVTTKAGPPPVGHRD